LTALHKCRTIMDMYPRSLKPLKSASFLLFGARGTGKSTLVKSLYEGQSNLFIDLLIEENEFRFLNNPDDLYKMVDKKSNQYDWAIIDEVQKIPKLLDVAHRIIANPKIKTKLILTGSSARKLKKGAANLLAGRAFANNLFPLTFLELGDDFLLDDYLKWGGLPGIYGFKESEEKKEYLRSYCSTYMKEEVWSEQLIKNLAPFRRFLEIASQMNGEIINFAKVSREVGCDNKTVQNYFSILEDTLLGFQLDAYHTSARKRLIEKPKFYLFDCGVKRGLDKTLNVELQSETYAYGRAFEHFIITQMFALSHYKRLDYSFFYLKTKDGAEIDLVIERPGKKIAIIEIKSAKRVDTADVKNLKIFAKDMRVKDVYCLSLDKMNRLEDGVNFKYWKDVFIDLGLLT